MEQTSLEHSIREEARRAIEAVKERQAAEIRQLDDNFDAEVADYKKQVESEGEKRREWELSRIDNKGILEQRKLRLRAMEEIVEASVEKAMKSVVEDSRYGPFVVRLVKSALEEINSNARVGLRKEDFALGKDIEEELRASGKSDSCTVVEDRLITRGGVVVEDVEGGRILNGTIERKYFRKSSVIRREVMEILKKHGFTE
ncbi:MAG: V-type ATP synthase subunit E family protein [Syntrophales bacterium]|nr:V-type ATP synthase subunit E family protein [Syntrophales bacterium]